MVFLAISGDGHSANQLHHEKRTSTLSRPGIEYLGNIGMVHHRKCLPLQLESGYHLTRVHAELENFDGDLALDRTQLLGKINRAETAFTNFPLYSITSVNRRK